MKTIEMVYHRLISPVNFAKNFDTMREFEQWAEQGDVLDLKCAIERFEQEEMYEHCYIMLKVLTNKGKIKI